MACNERGPLGNRVGEHNPAAVRAASRIPDALVERIRDLKEHEGLSLAQICETLGLPYPECRNTVHKICLYQRRNVTPTRWRLIYIPDHDDQPADPTGPAALDAAADAAHPTHRPTA